MLVDVVYSLHDLCKQVNNVSFRHLALSGKIHRYLALLADWTDHVHSLVIFKCPQQGDDVWVRADQVMHLYLLDMAQIFWRR